MKHSSNVVISYFFECAILHSNFLGMNQLLGLHFQAKDSCDILLMDVVTNLFFNQLDQNLDLDNVKVNEIAYQGETFRICIFFFL